MPQVNQPFQARTDQWWISPFNFCEEVRSQLSLPDKVQICDLTLREGRQVEGVSLRLDEVLLIAEKLVEAGVSMLQIHHDEPNEMIEIKKRFPQIQVEGLVHPTASLDPVHCREVVDEIVDHGADIVDLSLCFSEPQEPLFETMAGGQVSREEAMERTEEAVRYMASKATTAILLPDPMRMDLPYIKEVLRHMVDAGASILRLDDVTGQAIYPVYKYLFSELTKEFPGVTFAFHVHQDIGLGAAALYAAIEGGAQIVDAAVNGLGERAGIASLAEVATVLQLFYGLDAGIQLDKMKDLADLVSDITKWPIPPKQPIVGDQVFSDLVEVHYRRPAGADWCYSQWKPELFGHRKRIMLGHYSGPYALRAKAASLGLEIPEERIQELLSQVRSEIRLRKRALGDDEFARLVRELS